jgi:hypothetical protein
MNHPPKHSRNTHLDIVRVLHFNMKHTVYHPYIHADGTLFTSDR